MDSLPLGIRSETIIILFISRRNKEPSDKPSTHLLGQEGCYSVCFFLFSPLSITLSLLPLFLSSWLYSTSSCLPSLLALLYSRWESQGQWRSGCFGWRAGGLSAEVINVQLLPSFAPREADEKELARCTNALYRGTLQLLSGSLVES